MELLTVKSLANLLNCSTSTAKNYLRDMKEYYHPKSNKITMAHFNDYFNIPQLKMVKNG